MGLIPAYAGKTSGLGLIQAAVTAHPRVCGENRCTFVHLPPLTGSSPRMRGKQILEPRLSITRRLIPAYAGKTSSALLHRLRGWAHPRVCGENVSKSARVGVPPGSSPRMRGKLGLTQAPLADGGLIPAYAGKTVKERTPHQ